LAVPFEAVRIAGRQIVSLDMPAEEIRQSGELAAPFCRAISVSASRSRAFSR
jgi:hypothetical protein